MGEDGILERTQPGEDNPLAELSRAMVRLYKEQFGRGPTRSRSHWAGPDTLVCQLWETLTPAERNMAAMGEHARLRDVRLFFQHATEPQFRAAVEGIFDRRVRAFVSGMDTREDVSVEIFILHPVRLVGGVVDAGPELPPGRWRAAARGLWIPYGAATAGGSSWAESPIVSRRPRTHATRTSSGRRALSIAMGNLPRVR